MPNIPGKARRGTRMFQDYRKTISISCQKRLRVEWQRNSPRSLAERRVAFRALSPLDEFFLNSQVRVHSGSVPETSRSRNRENQELTEDHSQSDPYHDARVSLSQSSQNCCREDAYDMDLCWSSRPNESFSIIGSSAVKTSQTVETIVLKIGSYFLKVSLAVDKQID